MVAATAAALDLALLRVGVGTVGVGTLVLLAGGEDVWGSVFDKNVVVVVVLVDAVIRMLVL